MSMGMNRRMFLAVLGTTVACTAAASAGAPPRRQPIPSAQPLCYFGKRPAEPSARPRTAAIAYLES